MTFMKLLYKKTHHLMEQTQPLDISFQLKNINYQRIHGQVKDKRGRGELPEILMKHSAHSSWSPWHQLPDLQGLQECCLKTTI